MSVLYSIQSLRGIAASMVVLYHASNYLPDEHFFRSIRIIGNAGVDIFFVISGFVIYLATQNRFSPKEARQFLLRRIIRIVPAYWFYTMIALVIAAIAPNLFGSYVFDPLHAATSFFFIPSARPDGSVFPVLYLGWSLNFEMVFYLIFAALMLIVPRRHLILWLAIVFALLNFGVQFGKLDDSLFIFGNKLVFEFLAGCVIAKYWFEGKATVPVNVGWVGVIVAFLVLLGTEYFHVVDNRAFKWGLPSVFLVYFALSLEGHLGQFGKFAVFAGDISYSLYLSHLFTVPASLILLTKIGLADYSHTFAAVLFFYLASIGVASVAYKAFEEPALNYLKRCAGSTK